jgi:hypothetical protein
VILFFFLARSLIHPSHPSLHPMAGSVVLLAGFLVCAFFAGAGFVIVKGFQRRKMQPPAQRFKRNSRSKIHTPSWQTIAPVTLDTNEESSTDENALPRISKKQRTSPIMSSASPTGEDRTKQFFKRRSSTPETSRVNAKAPSYVHSSWTITFGGNPKGVAGDTTSLLTAEQATYDRGGLVADSAV